jgi:hypothetical protein
MLIKASYNLKETNIYNKPDLTPDQQREELKLRNLATQLKKSGCQNVKMRTRGVLMDGQFYKMHDIPKILNEEQESNSERPEFTWGSSNSAPTGERNDREVEIDDLSNEEDTLNNEQQIPDNNVALPLRPPLVDLCVPQEKSQM